MIKENSNNKKKHKILFLSHERKMGGANYSMYELAKALKDEGEDVHVAVLFIITIFLNNFLSL